MNKKTKQSMVVDYGNGEKEEIKVGDGCTICYYSDREPATIIAISEDEKTITVQQDKATRTDSNGMSDCQSYVYERDLNGTIRTYKRTRTNKSFYSENGSYRDWDTFLLFGVRRKYYDYSF